MQHFPDDTIRVERYISGKVYALCYFDREQGFYYMKRFEVESSDKLQYFLSEDGQCDLICSTDSLGAKLMVSYSGAHRHRPADEVDVDSFIAVKSHRAKGKRITTMEVAALRFVEPEIEEVEEIEEAEEATDMEMENGKPEIPSDANRGAIDDDSMESTESDSEQLILF